MSVLAANVSKFERGFVSTVTSRVCGPVKTHRSCATALHVWETFYWQKEGRKPNVNTRVAMIEYWPNYVAEIVAISEELRAMLPQITQFRIHESDTVKFETLRRKISGNIFTTPAVRFAPIFFLLRRRRR